MGEWERARAAECRAGALVFRVVGGAAYDEIAALCARVTEKRGDCFTAFAMTVNVLLWFAGFGTKQLKAMAAEAFRLKDMAAGTSCPCERYKQEQERRNYISPTRSFTSFRMTTDVLLKSSLFYSKVIKGYGCRDTPPCGRYKQDKKREHFVKEFTEA